MAIFGHFYHFRPNFGHFWANFEISQKLDKLYLKMKLLARAFQKSQSRVQKRSTKVKNRDEKAEKGQIFIFSKSRQIIPQNEALGESFS